MESTDSFARRSWWTLWAVAPSTESHGSSTDDTRALAAGQPIIQGSMSERGCYSDSSDGEMIASGVIARVRRILPTAQAATTKDAIARDAARRSVGPVLPSESAPTASQTATRKPDEARPRTIAAPVYRTVTLCPGVGNYVKGRANAGRSAGRWEFGWTPVPVVLQAGPLLSLRSPFAGDVGEPDGGVGSPAADH